MKLYKNKNWLYQKYIKEKLSSNKIGKMTGVKSSAIRCFLMKFGIPIRSCSEGMKLWHKNHPGVFGGEGNPNWKGGQRIDARGYVRILMPEHPKADMQGYVRRSHSVVEENLGKYLCQDEVTHHKNKIKDDDNSENIEVFTRANHTSFHNRRRKIK